VVTVVATTGKLRGQRARSGWDDLMTGSPAGSDRAASTRASTPTLTQGGYPPDRERDRLVALHRVSTLVAEQRRSEDVLREALQRAVALIGGDAGAIHRWFPESDTLRCVAVDGNHERIIRSVLRPGQGLTGRAFLNQTSIVENDYAGSALGTAWSKEAGLRAGIAVPITHGGRRIGVLSAGSYNPHRTFDAADAQLLEMLATMVAVALENAELNAELETRLDRIRKLSHLTRFAATCLDVEHVLPRIARAAVELAGAVFATFWMVDEAARTLRLGAVSDDDLAADMTARAMSFDEGASGWVAAHREPLTIDDVIADGRSVSRDWCARHGMRTSLTVPVMHGRRLLAVLSLNGREPFRLDVADQEILESFLAQAAASIRNTSLYSSVRRSQAQLQQIIDHSPAAISLRDRDGRYLLTNRRWHELFAPGDDAGDADLIGRTTTEVFPPARARGLRERDSAVLSTGKTVEHEGTVTTGGRTLTYHAIKFPLVDANGQPYAVCSMSADITDRKRWEQEIAAALEAQRAANEQLERLNKAKSDFVSIVSHELRSPLTGIQGFSELMRDEVTSIDEMREYSADINREAERLNRMINEVLDLDRIESGRMTLHRESIDLGDLVTEIVGRAASRASSHRLQVQLDASAPVVSADRDRLTQVLVNLLDNAVKYSPDGGEITLGVRRDGDVAYLWVRDQGLGIPADALESVFERYARLETDRHRTIRGTGLGLPIVRQIVELHGGRIWVESTPGAGSIFHVTLPVAGPVEA
jgi:PAS domain S-box-containing protein